LDIHYDSDANTDTELSALMREGERLGRIARPRGFFRRLFTTRQRRDASDSDRDRIHSILVDSHISLDPNRSFEALDLEIQRGLDRFRELLTLHVHEVSRPEAARTTDTEDISPFVAMLERFFRRPQPRRKLGGIQASTLAGGIESLQVARASKFAEYVSGLKQDTTEAVSETLYALYRRYRRRSEILDQLSLRDPIVVEGEAGPFVIRDPYPAEQRFLTDVIAVLEGAGIRVGGQAERTVLSVDRLLEDLAKVRAQAERKQVENPPKQQGANQKRPQSFRQRKDAKQKQHKQVDDWYVPEIEKAKQAGDERAVAQLTKERRIDHENIDKRYADD
jgi:hypothetical protein